MDVPLLSKQIYFRNSKGVTLPYILTPESSQVSQCIHAIRTQNPQFLGQLNNVHPKLLFQGRFLHNFENLSALLEPEDTILVCTPPSSTPPSNPSFPPAQPSGTGPTRTARGLDRLIALGLSSDEISAVRREFHMNHTGPVAAEVEDRFVDGLMGNATPPPPPPAIIPSLPLLNSPEVPMVSSPRLNDPTWGISYGPIMPLPPPVDRPPSPPPLATYDSPANPTNPTMSNPSAGAGNPLSPALSPVSSPLVQAPPVSTTTSTAPSPSPPLSLSSPVLSPRSPAAERQSLQFRFGDGTFLTRSSSSSRVRLPRWALLGLSISTLHKASLLVGVLCGFFLGPLMLLFLLERGIPPLFRVGILVGVMVNMFISLLFYVFFPLLNAR